MRTSSTLAVFFLIVSAECFGRPVSGNGTGISDTSATEACDVAKSEAISTMGCPNGPRGEFCYLDNSSIRVSPRGTSSKVRTRTFGGHSQGDQQYAEQYVEITCRVAVYGSCECEKFVDERH